MKQAAVWVTCNGEAHSNPYIDNCMVCLPYWGKYPICPICRHKLKNPAAKVGYCSNCKKHYDLM